MKISGRARYCCALIIAVMLSSATLYGAAVSDMDLDWFRDRPMEMQWGPDPFLPKVPMGEQSSSDRKFDLSAVILGGERPAAVMDGKVVHKGDVIGSYHVLRILTDTVVLKGQAGLVAVPLKPLFSLGGDLP